MNYAHFHSLSVFEHFSVLAAIWCRKKKSNIWIFLALKTQPWEKKAQNRSMVLSMVLNRRAPRVLFPDVRQGQITLTDDNSNSRPALGMQKHSLLCKICQNAGEEFEKNVSPRIKTRRQSPQRKSYILTHEYVFVHALFFLLLYIFLFKISVLSVRIHAESCTVRAGNGKNIWPFYHLDSPFRGTRPSRSRP